jgi:hypothetical protein
MCFIRVLYFPTSRGHGSVKPTICWYCTPFLLLVQGRATTIETAKCLKCSKSQDELKETAKASKLSTFILETEALASPALPA